MLQGRFRGLRSRCASGYNTVCIYLINDILGLGAIDRWRFPLTTALGIVPVTVVVVIFGSYWHDGRVLALVTTAAVLVSTSGDVMLRWRSVAAWCWGVTHR